MNRILGLDFGSKTVGVAVSDPLGFTAQGLTIIRREKENHLRQTFRKLKELAEEYDIKAVVLGYPLNMDDSIGDRALRTLQFGEELRRRLRVPVFMHDERLTTVEADEVMTEMGVKREDFKKYVDKIASTIILQEWLDNHGSDEICNG